ncbi:MAG: hypothetical protein RBR67_02320 [Desulfobacterium sp.]|nr:hypothetical protein [Desulfobacterium sp.]
MLEAIRAHFANELGVAYGSHFYLDPDHFNRGNMHETLLGSLKSEIHRSTELFNKPFHVINVQ